MVSRVRSSAAPAQTSLPSADAEQPMFRHVDGSVSNRGDFAATVRRFAASLPSHRYVVNLCEDRFAFAVTFAAAAQRGMTVLLPPSDAPAVAAALREDYADGFIVADREGFGHVLAPRLPPSVAGDVAALPSIDAAYPAAIVFTSGSTGRPQAHLKTWGSLLGAGERIAARLFDPLGAVQMVATVPMQHMYGLETAAAVPLASRHSIQVQRPVFPRDVTDALAALPAPRVLVTTPVHIRALLNSGITLPPLARVLSATAPLSVDLAARAEAALQTQVHEIYGCSEAGSIATRRCVDGPDWHPLDGMRLLPAESGCVVIGEHLPEPVPLADLLETTHHRQKSNLKSTFRLIGRADDLLKVGGKRASLADLTAKLLSIEGVIDAVVFQPDTAGDVVTRPAALVVAPELDAAHILLALSRLIDPVFLPRPLKRVPNLPRNAVGKLPRAELARLLIES
jgi:acyl-coenzyme A synthetase/AMP-(fatty) acid ligase